MQYVKLFEQFVNEVVDLKSAYPYHMVNEPGDDFVHHFEAEFVTKSGMKYQAVLNPKGHKSIESYEYNFSPVGKWFDTMTDEHDAIKVIATAGKILKDAIQKYNFLPIPIYIKGFPNQGENPEEESSRDRIYKAIAKRDFKNFRPGNQMIAGYRFADMGEDGFALEPINIEDDELENEAINMFDGKTDKVL